MGMTEDFETSLQVLGGFDTDISVEVNEIKLKQYFRWKPPITGWLKLNVDGAVFVDLCKSGIGCVLRDDKGEALMAASKLEFEFEDPEALELTAVFRGLQLCASMGISHLQLEADCLLVLEALQKQDSMEGSILGLLYKEIMRLSSCFVECNFIYVHGKGNKAAHKLARYAKYVEDIRVW